MGQHIVVWDPGGTYWEGALLDSVKARQLEHAGIVSMPVDASLFKLSGVGGYHRRAWGAGYPLDHLTPRLFAPLTLWCPVASHDRPRKVHWRMRLVPEPALEGDPREGSIRIASDSGQHNPHVLGLSSEQGDVPAVQVAGMGPRDARGGWVVGGHCGLRASQEAHYPIAFYGSAPGLRVAWAAVTLG